MSDHTSDFRIDVHDSASERAEARFLLDRLLVDSKLYTSGRSYQELLDFVAKLPNFAPFNAMLLHVQKPGLSYAASAYDWREIFRRQPKENARPLLILWPMGPVALVYDVLDTEGEELPKDVMSFLARDKSSNKNWRKFRSRLESKEIGLEWFDAGDRKAGYIKRSNREGERYRIQMNRNHDSAVQFVTLAHELGHLYLGHFGPDKKLRVPKRFVTQRAEQEIEAESVAYLVAKRNNVESSSEKYLSGFVRSDTTVDRLDVHQIMRATGQVEALLGLQARNRFEPKPDEVQQRHPSQQELLFERRHASDGA